LAFLSDSENSVKFSGSFLSNLEITFNNSSATSVGYVVDAATIPCVAVIISLLSDDVPFVPHSKTNCNDFFTFSLF